MDTIKSHRFQVDAESHRFVCKCGKPLLDPIHQTDIRLMHGTARPTKVGSS